MAIECRYKKLLTDWIFIQAPNFHVALSNQISFENDAFIEINGLYPLPSLILKGP